MTKRALDGRPQPRTSGLWYVWRGFRVRDGGAGSLGVMRAGKTSRGRCCVGAWLLGGGNSAGRRARERVNVLVAQSRLTLCNLMSCSPPGSSAHGILQARILEWVAIAFSRGSSRPRDGTWVSCTAGRFFPT